MIDKLERLPQDDETIELDNGITLQAKGVQDNRIVKVLIMLPAADTSPEAVPAQPPQ